jgi:hypothetical protein
MELKMDLKKTVAHLLLAFGANDVAIELARQLEDVPLFASILNGGDIWAIAKLNVMPPWHVRRVENVLSMMAELRMVSDWRVERMGWGHLIVGVRGTRESISRVITVIERLQGELTPPVKLRVNPQSGDWNFDDV